MAGIETLGDQGPRTRIRRRFDTFSHISIYLSISQQAFLFFFFISLSSIFSSRHPGCDA